MQHLTKKKKSKKINCKKPIEKNDLFKNTIDKVKKIVIFGNSYVNME